MTGRPHRSLRLPFQNNATRSKNFLRPGLAAGIYRRHRSGWTNRVQTAGSRNAGAKTGAVFSHELSVAFPEASLIHTERPEADWWSSYNHTINRFWQNRKSIRLPPLISAVFDDMDQILGHGGDAGFDRDG